LELARLLRVGRPVDVRVLHLNEFPFSTHAKMSLVRDVCLILPDGFPKEREGVFELADAYSHWITFVAPELSPDHDERLTEAWSRVKKLAPVGWLPESIDDPVIVAAFEGIELDDIDEP